jgi:hypothetical protein
MRDCTICEIKMSSINAKEGLTRTNTTQLLLSATYPDSGDSKRECSQRLLRSRLSWVVLSSVAVQFLDVFRLTDGGLWDM